MARHPLLTHMSTRTEGTFRDSSRTLSYVLGARSIEAQDGLTTLSVGFASMLLGYLSLSRIGTPLFALIASLTLVTDYLFFGQWQIVTMRVWHGFFLFSSLMLVLQMRSRKWWLLATFVNYLFLFYFEYVFALFVAILCGVYALCLYFRDWRILLHAWAAQAVGSCASVLLMVIQLVAYLGWSGFTQDAYLTYVSRNGANQESLLPLLKEFYTSHNIVFWYDIVDTSELRSPAKFLVLVFQWIFQIDTPLFILVILTVILGWLSGLPSWRVVSRTRFGTQWSSQGGCAATGGGVVPAWIGSLHFNISVEARLHRDRMHVLGLYLRDGLALSILALGLYLSMLRVVRDSAFLGLPSTAFERVWWTGGFATTFGAAVLAIATSIALVRLARRRSPNYRLSWLPRLAATILLLFFAVRLIESQPALYDQGARGLWLGQLQAWLPLDLERGVAITVIGFAASLAWLGSERVLGVEANTALRNVAACVGCALLAFVAIYLISPGYVLSIYLTRVAPLGVLILDAAVAIVAYALVAAAVRAIRGSTEASRMAPRLSPG